MKNGKFEPGDRVVIVSESPGWVGPNRPYYKGDRGVVVKHELNDERSVRVMLSVFRGVVVKPNSAWTFVTHTRMQLDDAPAPVWSGRMLDLN